MSNLKLIEENVKAWMRFYEDPNDRSHIIIEWEDAYGGRPQKPISRVDYEAYKNGERAAYDIVVKAQTGHWPPTEEEKIRTKKEFVKNAPTALIADPSNRDLFTEAELENIIPIAEKQWIEWKGKLPDGYVSPLE